MDSQKLASTVLGEPWDVNHLKVLMPGGNDLHGK
jgi:hypothetical protein